MLQIENFKSDYSNLTEENKRLKDQITAKD